MTIASVSPREKLLQVPLYESKSDFKIKNLQTSMHILQVSEWFQIFHYSDSSAHYSPQCCQGQLHGNRYAINTRELLLSIEMMNNTKKVNWAWLQLFGTSPWPRSTNWFHHLSIFRLSFWKLSNSMRVYSGNLYLDYKQHRQNVWVTHDELWFYICTNMMDTLPSSSVSSELIQTY